jgi:hypothetical protein
VRLGPKDEIQPQARAKKLDRAVPLPQNPNNQQPLFHKRAYHGNRSVLRRIKRLQNDESDEDSVENTIEEVPKRASSMKPASIRVETVAPTPAPV